MEKYFFSCYNPPFFYRKMMGHFFLTFFPIRFFITSLRLKKPNEEKLKRHLKS